MAATVAIVDACSGSRERFARMLNQSSAFHCTGSYDSLGDALAGFSLDAPDVVLLSENEARRVGLECVTRLRALGPTPQVVLLLEAEDADWILQALARGACGYVQREDSAARVLRLLDEVLRGGSPISSQVARKLVNCLQTHLPLAPQDGNLSLRERQILEYLAQGYPYKQIAGLLSISIDTVRTYIRRLYAKLNVRSRAHAMLKCRAFSEPAWTR